MHAPARPLAAAAIGLALAGGLYAAGVHAARETRPALVFVSRRPLAVGAPRVPLTFGPTGGADSARDPRSGRLLFSRWWFNPFVVGLRGGFDGATTGDAQRRLASQWQVLDAEPVLDPDGRLSLVDLHL